jgi:endonuclease/exonuclease/phosphatase family metal-dependent hydrolase
VRSVHLGLDAGERYEHLSRLTPGCAVDAAFGPWRDAPTVLGGDLNEEPGGPVHQRLCTVLVDVAAAAGSTEPTFPARAPRRRLDLLLADRQLSVVGVHVPTAHPGASDHLPVVADLVVPAGPG